MRNDLTEEAIQRICRSGIAQQGISSRAVERKKSEQRSRGCLFKHIDLSVLSRSSDYLCILSQNSRYYDGRSIEALKSKEHCRGHTYDVALLLIGSGNMESISGTPIGRLSEPLFQ